MATGEKIPPDPTPKSDSSRSENGKWSERSYEERAEDARKGDGRLMREQAEAKRQADRAERMTAARWKDGAPLEEDIRKGVERTIGELLDSAERRADKAAMRKYSLALKIMTREAIEDAGRGGPESELPATPKEHRARIAEEIEAIKAIAGEYPTAMPKPKEKPRYRVKAGSRAAESTNLDDATLARASTEAKPRIRVKAGSSRANGAELPHADDPHDAWDIDAFERHGKAVDDPHDSWDASEFEAHAAKSEANNAAVSGSPQEAAPAVSATDLESSKAIMDAAGEAYFAAYKELHKAGLGAADAGPEVERLAELKRAYDATRSAYHREAMKGTVNWKEHMGEIFRKPLEREQQLRVEGMSEAKRAAFMRAIEWYGKGNIWLDQKIGKLGARSIRALVGGAIVAGSFATFGGLSTLAAVGYGSWRAGRALLGMYAGGAAAEVTGSWFRKWGEGRQAAAEAKLASTVPGDVSNELSIEQIEEIDAKRRGLAYKASDAALARKTAVVKALTALGVGAGLASLLADGAIQAESSVRGGESAADARLISQPPPAEPESAGSGPIPLVPEEGAPLRGPQDVPTEGAPVPEGTEDMQEVAREMHEYAAKSGDGGIRLIEGLRKEMIGKGLTPDSPNLTPEMKAVLEADTPAEAAQLARQYGFYKPENPAESAVIGKGDTLKFDADGKLVYSAGDKTQVINAEKPFTGKFIDTDPPPRPEPKPAAAVEGAERASVPRPEAPLPPESRPPVPPASEASPNAVSRAAEPLSPRIPHTLSYEQFSALSDSERVRYLNEHGAAPTRGEVAPAEASPVREPATPARAPGYVPPEAVSDLRGSSEAVVRVSAQDYLPNDGSGGAGETIEAIAPNKHGVSVPSQEPHIYGEGRNGGPPYHAHGGTDQERADAAERFLRANPKAVVLMPVGPVEGGKMVMVEARLVNGTLTYSAPIRNTFLGFGGWADAPKPDDFRKLIY